MFGAMAMLDGSGKLRMRAMPRLHGRDEFAENLIPFLVRQTRRVDPGARLRFERDVGPIVMAVRGEMDPLRICFHEAGEVAGEIEHLFTPRHRRSPCRARRARAEAEARSAG